MDYQTVLEAAITSFGVVFGFGWFFWQRYQSLEKRFDRIESELTMQKHRLDTVKLVTDANQLNIQQLVTANKALIEHRTQRFTDQIKSVEERLGTDIKEVKRWLDAHTEFKTRER